MHKFDIPSGASHQTLLPGACSILKLVTNFDSVFSDYTVFRKKTPTHIFFHISMNYLWI